MRPSPAKQPKRGQLSSSLFAHRQRLHDALALGLRVNGDKGREWLCKDAGIQSHALKTMTSFIELISSDLLQHPDIKETIADMLVVLEGILGSKIEATLSLAANVCLKLLHCIGDSIFHYQILGIASSLSTLLSTGVPYATLYAAALNYILSKLGPRGGVYLVEVWSALEMSNTVSFIALALQDCRSSSEIVERVNLLRTISCYWHLSRHYIWGNDKIMNILERKLVCPDSSVVAATLKLYASLVLCCSGAGKLLTDRNLLSIIVQCITKAHPMIVRVEALKLLQISMRDVEKARQLLESGNVSLAQAVAEAISGVSSLTAKGADGLVIEICRTALMVLRIPGDHHSYFWTSTIVELLHNALIENHGPPVIQPYVWEILGYMTINYTEYYHCKLQGIESSLRDIISRVCAGATDVTERKCSPSSEGDHVKEFIFRTVFMMIISPSWSISSMMVSKLSVCMTSISSDHLQLVLSSVKLYGSQDTVSSIYLHIMICLACFAKLPQYQDLIVKSDGTGILLALIKKCLCSDIHINRVKHTPHLQFCFASRMCCLDNLLDWEGEDTVLFYSLAALSGLIRFMKDSCGICKDGGLMCMACQPHNTEDLITTLQLILSRRLSCGPRSYAMHILSYFGRCGTPSKFGRKMGYAISETDLADLELLSSDGQSIKVHTAILAVRCPNLLPHGNSRLKGENRNTGNSNKEVLNKNKGKEIVVVRMSNRVDFNLLHKILEYVYSGYLEINESDVKSLNTLAKTCGIKSLQGFLRHEQPKWGIALPSYNLLDALNPASASLWDVVVQAKSAETVTCPLPSCQLSTAHMHAHKIILCVSCDYIRALFNSGMHDSFADVITIPVSWRALQKLVHWFYSGDLPGAQEDFGSTEKRMSELRAYVELSSLAEYWLLEEVGLKCLEVFRRCIKSGPEAYIEILCFAASLGQWKMLEEGVRCTAHLYPKLRNEGLLEDLDEAIVNMLRAEYVQYSQNRQ